METKKNYVAFDCGNSSIRVMAGLYDGRKIELRRVHQLPNEAIHVNGIFYWDILYIFRELQLGLKKAYLEYGPVESAGISTWGIDFGLIGKSGQLLGNPLCYRNAFGETALQEISEANKYKTFMATGIMDHPMNSLYQLIGIKKCLPEYYKEAQWLLLMPDLLAWLFTGSICGESSIASTTQILDMRNETYASQVIDLYHLNGSLFPAFIRHGESCGHLKQDIARALKINSFPFVSIASHDTASAVVSVPTQAKNFLFISSGTWSLIGTQLEDPIINRDVYTQGFSNEGGALGTITFLKNSTGMHILQNIKKEMEQGGRNYDWEEIVSLANACKTRVPVFNPNDTLFFNPQDMSTAICKYTKKDLAIEEVLASAYLSLACSYRDGIEKIEKLTQKTYPVIHIVGGGCKNNHLNQLTADITGKTVIAGPEDATSLGNIGLQLKRNKPDIDLLQIKKILMASISVQSFIPNADSDIISEINAYYQEYKNLDKSG